MESGSRSKPSSGPPSSPATRGAFANTHYTLLGRLLELGEEGHREAGNHIMQVYAHPLRVYFLGSSFANDLGDADDIVRGFFADRLSRPTFLHDWQISGKRLRFWLITAFKHYLHEQRYGVSRDKRWQSLEDQNGAGADDSDSMRGHAEGADDRSPEHAFHREVAMSLVRQALDRARASCAETGHAAHWEAMLRHHLDGRTFEELSSEYNIDSARLRVMARTAGNRLRRCLREELSWPHAHREDIDREICLLMEVLQT